MVPDNCPACESSFQGELIPEEHQHLFGDTHFSRVIGVELPEVYDGTLYWVCPDCDYAWPRWTDGLGRLTGLSAKYVAEYNNCQAR